MVECGAYQFHMDPTKAIDARYGTGQFHLAPAETVSDIIELEGREYPTAPALCLKKDLDGTNTPSKEGNSHFQPIRLTKEDSENFKDNFPEKCTNKHYQLIYNLASPKTAPVVGEFYNQTAPMFLDFDPNVKSVYKGSGKFYK